MSSDNISENISKLLNKPSEIESEINNVMEEMNNTTFSHYGSFIKFSQSIEQINNNRAQMTSQMSTLKVSLESIKPNMNDFKVDQTLFLNQNEIENVACILKMPKTVDSLIEEGNYDEVHQILSLWKKLSPIPIIKKILHMMESSYDRMIDLLLAQLKSGSGRVSDLLKVVTVLRKSGRFTGGELRKCFLQGRTSGVNCRIMSINNNLSSFEKISSLVELYREHVFESVTQFSAIFGNSSTELAPWTRNQLKTMLNQLEASRDVLSIHNLTILRDYINFLCATLLKIKANFSVFLKGYHQSLVMLFFDKNMRDLTKKLIDHVGENVDLLSDSDFVGDYSELVEDQKYEIIREYFVQVSALVKKVKNLVTSSAILDILQSISYNLAEISRYLSRNAENLSVVVSMFGSYCVPKCITDVEELFCVRNLISTLNLKLTWGPHDRLKCFDTCLHDSLLPLKDVLT